MLHQVQFGYIYGFSVFGCLALQGIMNLIHPVGLDFWRTCSVLGYCLLPVILLAAIGIVLKLKGVVGLLLACAAIAWSTISATRY
jgi:protein YIPF5/7